MKKNIFPIVLFIGIILIGVYTLITDRMPPIINVSNTIENEYHIGSELPSFIEVISVEDNELGEVELVVSYDDVNMNEIGEYFINVSATDKAGNTSNKSIKIYVKDLEPPLINGYRDIYYVQGDSLPDYTSHISVYDNHHDVMVEDVIIDDTKVDYNTLGTYDLTYSLSDGDNTSKVYINVHVVDEVPSNLEIQIGDTLNMKTKDHHKNVVFNETWLDDVTLSTMMSNSGKSSRSNHSFDGDVQSELEELSINNEVFDTHFNTVMNYIESHYDLSLMSSARVQFLETSYISNHVTLPQSYNLDAYQKDISSDFLSALERIDNNELTYNTFFDHFGTHVIVEKSYGKEFSLVCVEVNEDYQFRKNGDPCDYNSLSLLDSKASSFTVAQTNKTSIVSISKASLSPIAKINEKNSDLINDWYNENEAYVLIEFGPDNRGLRPIYQAIPETYAHLKSQMETALNNYIH